MGFWGSILSRKDPIPVAAMSPNVTYVGGPGELLDELAMSGIRGLSVPSLWRTQPHLRTVVSFRARNIAHLGLHCFARSGDDRQRDRTSPLAQLLARPNADQTLFELLFALVGDLDLYDRAYWLVGRDADSASGWTIRRLPPTWVSVSKRSAFSVTEYLISLRDESVKIPADQILAFTGYHPTSALAVSPTVESLRETLAEQVEAAKFRGQIWKRGGRVSAVLQRPKDAPWSDAAREAFRADWYAKYTGDGSLAGGTPILEDGMTLQRIDFTAQEQQFVEAAKLALSTVASAYHINPTMVGVLDNANYSNVREFRRMLYGDSLGPTLAQIEDRLNAFLLPMIGADPSRQFVEFNIGEKLQGSFEEQAAVMSTLVGRPVMTADEGRAKFNLPALGGDAAQLVTPLNVLVGGQASPRDSGSQNETGKRGQVGHKEAVALLKAQPADRQVEKVAEVLGRFFERQSKTVLSAIGAGGDWWDADRWDAELADDLHRTAVTIAGVLGADEAKALGFNSDDYDADRTVDFLRAASERYAKNINLTTKAQLDAAVDSDDADPAQVFDTATTSRAAGVALGVGVFLAGFATREAASQITEMYAMDATKTWVTGPNARPSHAAMDGETVALDEDFSNGLPWPGAANGTPDETAGCNCSLRITLTPKEG